MMALLKLIPSREYETSYITVNYNCVKCSERKVQDVMTEVMGELTSQVVRESLPDKRDI